MFLSKLIKSYFDHTMLNWEQKFLSSNRYKHPNKTKYSPKYGNKQSKWGDRSKYDSSGSSLRLNIVHWSSNKLNETILPYRKNWWNNDPHNAYLQNERLRQLKKLPTTTSLNYTLKVIAKNWNINAQETEAQANIQHYWRLHTLTSCSRRRWWKHSIQSILLFTRN